jgi:hypothetical protein
VHLQGIVVQQTHIRHIQKHAVCSAMTSRCPLLQVVAHSDRSCVEVVACVAQDLQVLNLGPGNYEADHTDGAAGHHHPFHLELFSLLTTMRNSSVMRSTFVGYRWLNECSHKLKYFSATAFIWPDDTRADNLM